MFQPSVAVHFVFFLFFSLCRHYFYAPNFEEVEGAYWCDLIRLSVRLSITLLGACETSE